MASLDDILTTVVRPATAGVATVTPWLPAVLVEHSVVIDDDAPATQIVEPFSKSEFYTAGAEIASTLNRELHSLIHKRGWSAVMSRLGVASHDAIAAIRDVSVANVDMYEGSRDSVMALHHGRQWEPRERKKTIMALKRGCVDVDNAIEQVGKLRAAVNACEEMLKDAKVCMTKTGDSYKALEERFKAANT